MKRCRNDETTANILLVISSRQNGDAVVQNSNVNKYTITRRPIVFFFFYSTIVKFYSNSTRDALNHVKT